MKIFMYLMLILLLIKDGVIILVERKSNLNFINVERTLVTRLNISVCTHRADNE